MYINNQYVEIKWLVITVLVCAVGVSAFALFWWGVVELTIAMFKG